MRPSHCHRLAVTLPSLCPHMSIASRSIRKSKLVAGNDDNQHLPCGSRRHHYHSQHGPACKHQLRRQRPALQNLPAQAGLHEPLPDMQHCYDAGKGHARPPAGRRPLQQPQVARPTRARWLRRRPQVAQQQRGRHRARWLRRRPQVAQQQRGRHRARWLRRWQ